MENETVSEESIRRETTSLEIESNNVDNEIIMAVIVFRFCNCYLLVLFRLVPQKSSKYCDIEEP